MSMSFSNKSYGRRKSLIFTVLLTFVRWTLRKWSQFISFELKETHTDCPLCSNDVWRASIQRICIFPYMSTFRFQGLTNEILSFKMKLWMIRNGIENLSVNINVNIQLTINISIDWVSMYRSWLYEPSPKGLGSPSHERYKILSIIK